MSGRQARALLQPEKGHTTASAVSIRGKWATGSAHPLGLGSPSRALQQVGIFGHVEMPAPGPGRAERRAPAGPEQAQGGGGGRTWSP